MSGRARSGLFVPLSCLLAGGATIGVSTNLAKLADENGLPPLAFLTWSLAGAAVVLIGVAAVRGAALVRRLVAQRVALSAR